MLHGKFGMIKNILLTGGTGFIGSQVLKLLVQNGFNITLLKRSNSDTYRITKELNNITTFDIDILDIEQLFEHHRFDMVIHMATHYVKYEESSDINPLVQVNIAFPSQILYHSVKNNVPYFINTGTFFEYDIANLPIQEDKAVTNPFNFYAQTKIAFEALLKGTCEKSDIKGITLKIFTPYGEYDNPNKLIPSLIKKALSQEKIELSQGYQKLDFVYVKDIAAAYLAAIESIGTLETEYDNFNVGTGFPYSIREVVSTLEEILGTSINKKWGPASQLEIPITYCDPRKTWEKLKWKSKFDLKQGLSQTLQYYAGGGN